MRGKHLVMMGAIALASCSRFTVGSLAYAPPLPESEEPSYGRPTRWLTQQDFDRLYHLAWPQSQADMHGTFGLPARIEAGAEVYKLVESPQEVWIRYEGTQATGYQIR